MYSNAFREAHGNLRESYCSVLSCNRRQFVEALFPSFAWIDTLFDASYSNACCLRRNFQSEVQARKNDGETCITWEVELKQMVTNFIDEARREYQKVCQPTRVKEETPKKTRSKKGRARSSSSSGKGCHRSKDTRKHKRERKKARCFSVVVCSQLELIGSTSVKSKHWYQDIYSNMIGHTQTFRCLPRLLCKLMSFYGHRSQQVHGRLFLVLQKMMMTCWLGGLGKDRWHQIVTQGPCHLPRKLWKSFFNQIWKNLFQTPVTRPCLLKHWQQMAWNLVWTNCMDSQIVFAQSIMFLDQHDKYVIWQ